MSQYTRGAAWARPLLRKHPQLGSEIRPDDRATAAATPSSAERSLAPRRDGGPDRRQTDVPLARGRSRRRDPRRAASAPPRPRRGRKTDAQAAAQTRLRAKEGDDQPAGLVSRRLPAPRALLSS